MQSVLAALCALGLSSCGSEPKPRGDGRLVLELGGSHASLRGALLQAGVVIEPRPTPASGGVVQGGVVQGGVVRGSMDEILGVPPIRSELREPVPVPVPEPRMREVALQSGETLSHLASRHLGTVRRTAEILELNGWTEEQSRRLGAGTLVKLPPK